MSNIVIDGVVLPNVRGKYRVNAMMSRRSWFGVGGKADVIFFPYDIEDLIYFLKCVGKDLPITVLGAGSNILVRDTGLRGVVIKLGKAFVHMDIIADGIIRAGGGVLSRSLSQFAYQNGISGYEFLYSIPGSIGGNSWMNAGASGFDMSDIIDYIICIDLLGNMRRFFLNEIGYVYRDNALSEQMIITEIVFRKMSRMCKDDIYSRISSFHNARIHGQPISARTGGSTFKNPKGLSAWKLIDKADCRGLRCGGALVSEKHCNFIINEDNATALDIESLINEIIMKVKETSGIVLETEIKILG